MMEYEGTPEKVYELLLEADKPMYHEDIQEQLSVPESYVGSALMELYDDGKADWPAADEWVAVPEHERVVEGMNANIHIGYDTGR